MGGKGGSSAAKEVLMLLIDSMISMMLISKDKRGKDKGLYNSRLGFLFLFLCLPFNDKCK